MRENAEKFFNDHYGYAIWYAKFIYKSFTNFGNFQDIKQGCLIALWKCANEYDESMSHEKVLNYIKIKMKGYIYDNLPQENGLGQKRCNFKKNPLKAYSFNDDNLHDGADSSASCFEDVANWVELAYQKIHPEQFEKEIIERDKDEKIKQFFDYIQRSKHIKHRQVFVLILDGKSHREIAESMKVHESRISQIISQVRKDFKRAIQNK